MYVPVSQPQPSPEAQDLGEKLVHLVREFRAGHPTVSQEEIEQAFHLARTRTRSEGGGSRTLLRVVAAGLIGLAVLGAAVFLYLGQGGGAELPPIAVATVALAIVSVGVAVVTAATMGGGARVRPVAAVLLGLLLFATLVALLVFQGSGILPEFGIKGSHVMV